MNIHQLAQLIDEHAEYCMFKYQPHNLRHLSMDEALRFQQEMTQSLTHFSIWLQSVKSKETTPNIIVHPNGVGEIIVDEAKEPCDYCKQKGREYTPECEENK